MKGTLANFENEMSCFKFHTSKTFFLLLMKKVLIILTDKKDIAIMLMQKCL